MAALVTAALTAVATASFLAYGTTICTDFTELGSTRLPVDGELLFWTFLVGAPIAGMAVAALTYLTLWDPSIPEPFTELSSLAARVGVAVGAVVVTGFCAGPIRLAIIAVAAVAIYLTARSAGEFGRAARRRGDHRSLGDRDENIVQTWIDRG